jgi:lactoylglutathione lyase
MSETRRARAVGFNHVALEVGDIEEALSFYERIFEFKLRGKSKDMAFIDLGDQFLALQKGRSQPSDGGRHFGLVVDDKNAARRALAEAGVELLPGPFLDFRDRTGLRSRRSAVVGQNNPDCGGRVRPHHRHLQRERSAARGGQGRGWLAVAANDRRTGRGACRAAPTVTAA